MERYREYSATTANHPNGIVTLERWTVQIDDIAQVDTLTVDNSAAVVNQVSLIRYQYRDHLGSASLETNENGQVISYEEYHPFGTSAYRTAKSGTDLSLKRYRFTNKERDDETGLYYFGVRYYAAWLGRWTSSDPGDFVDGLNMYVYVRNNPVNGVDELGYETDPPPTEPVKGGNALGQAADYAYVGVTAFTDEQAALSIARGAGLSIEDVRKKMANTTLWEAFKSDRANNRWIFETPSYDFSSGLKGTAKEISQIAAVSIGAPLLAPVVGGAIGEGILAASSTGLAIKQWVIFNPIYTIQSGMYGSQFGLGLFEMNLDTKKAIGHTGGIDSFRSNLSYFPAKNFSIAYITNGEDYSMNQLMIGVLSSYFEEEYEFPVFEEEEKLNESDIKNYIGVYSSSELPFDITINKKNGVLIAQATGQPSFTLKYVGEHQFTFDPAGLTMIFNPEKQEAKLIQHGKSLILSQKKK